MLLVYYAFCILLSFVYIFILLFVISYWDNSDDSSDRSDAAISANYLSIIIPARNEEHNIEACLSSIKHNTISIQSYEIILVNDHSTDKTVEIANNMNLPNLRILHLSDILGSEKINAYKKEALSYGIKNAVGDIIITTDADCRVRQDWLKLILQQFADPACQVLTGPVFYNNESSYLEKFQSLEMLGTMAFTAAGIRSTRYFLANGANLAFDKEIYLKVKGYEKHMHLASGDDIFFVQQAAKIDPKAIRYTSDKDSIVLTRGVTTIRDFINQRIRWATKTTSYQQPFLFFVLGSVFLYCLSMLINLLLIPFFGAIFFFILLFQVFCKAVLDYLFLARMADYFQKSHLLKSFFPSFFFHIGYIIVISFAGLFVKKYRWKDRLVQ